jgi:hypothetical protein
VKLEIERIPRQPQLVIDVVSHAAELLLCGETDNEAGFSSGIAAELDSVLGKGEPQRAEWGQGIDGGPAQLPSNRLADCRTRDLDAEVEQVFLRAHQPEQQLDRPAVAATRYAENIGALTPPERIPFVGCGQGARILVDAFGRLSGKPSSRDPGNPAQELQERTTRIHRVNDDGIGGRLESPRRA